MTKISIYTDGSALGNPGPGGYGIVMICGKHRKDISQGYQLTTNNRMELLAVIVALETIKVEQAEVTVYSDSKYVVDAIEKGWVFTWVKKGFKKKKESGFMETIFKDLSQAQAEICVGKRAFGKSVKRTLRPISC